MALINLLGNMCVEMPKGYKHGVAAQEDNEMWPEIRKTFANLPPSFFLLLSSAPLAKKGKLGGRPTNERLTIINCQKGKEEGRERERERRRLVLPPPLLARRPK